MSEKKEAKTKGTGKQAEKKSPASKAATETPKKAEAEKAAEQEAPKTQPPIDVMVPLKRLAKISAVLVVLWVVFFLIVPRFLPGVPFNAQAPVNVPPPSGFESETKEPAPAENTETPTPVETEEEEPPMDEVAEPEEVEEEEVDAELPEETQETIEPQLEAVIENQAVAAAAAAELEAERQRLAAIEERLNRLADMAAAQPVAHQAALSVLEQQLSDQSREIDQLRAEQQHALRIISVMDAYDRLKEGVASGKPFVSELERMRQGSLGWESVQQEIDKLEIFSLHGIPRLEFLQSSYDKAARKALQPRAKEEDGMWQSIVANFGSLVSVRRVGEVEGLSNEAIVARAETELDKGDVATALETLLELPSKSGAEQAMQEWTSHASAYLVSQKVLRDMKTALLSARAEVPEVVVQAPVQLPEPVQVPAPVVKAVPEVAPAPPADAPKKEEPVKQEAKPAPAKKEPKAEAPAPKKPQPKPKTETPKKPVGVTKEAPKKEAAPKTAAKPTVKKPEEKPEVKNEVKLPVNLEASE